MPQLERTMSDDPAVRARRLDLPLLLPEVPDERDACVGRLVSLLERREGILRVHVALPGEAPHGTPGSEGGADGVAALCLHYDPERVTLTQVESLARAAGAEVTERYAHALVPFRLVDTEDDGQRLERALCGLPGVTAANVSLAAQVARE